MTATIKVLSAGTVAIAAYFTALLESCLVTSYYAAERAGIWCGSAAKYLGLADVVRSQDLTQVLIGRAPWGEQLKQPRRRNGRRKERHRFKGRTNRPEAKPVKAPTVEHVPGVDLQFAVPKSVSAAWALASPATRARFENCALQAARHVVKFIEATLPLARRGWGGTTEVHAEILAAMFLHTLNRANEPHLHVHCVIPNLVRTEDGRWTGINTRLLHNWTPTLGRIFRAELGRQLQLELGLRLYRPRNAEQREETWFAVEGVPQELTKHWSSRRRAIEANVDETALQRGSDAARKRQAACLETREAKEHIADLRPLYAKWQAEAAQFGFDAAKVSELCGRARKPLSVKRPNKLYEKAFANALGRLTESEAHFSARDLVREVCEELQHTGVSGCEVAQHVLEDLHRRSEIVPLQEYRGEEQFTTRTMWELEEKLLNDIQELQQRPGADLSQRKVRRVLQARPDLSDEQRQAAHTLLTTSGAIRILDGDAGTGKSTTLSAVRQTFERAGYRVIGGALAGVAREELQEKSGIESRTVASYLYQLDKPLKKRLAERVQHDARMLARAAQGRSTWRPRHLELNRRTVLIVDEAGMLATRSLSRLVHHVKKANATLILVGDPQQLPPINAGNPFDRLVRTAAKASLHENQRQLDPADRHAIEELKRGHVEEALQNYAERGRLVVEDNRERAIEKLVETWTADGGTRDPRNHVTFAQTRADAKHLNQLCQNERLIQGDISSRHSISCDGDRFYVGDRVLFHHAVRSEGVENGHFGTVVKLDPLFRRVTISLDHEPSATARARGFSQIVTIPLSRHTAAPFTLGYAATTHKLQGRTVNHSLVLLGGRMTDKQMTYVQLTRAKHSTTLFIDRPSAGDDLAELVKSVRRFQEKKLAHDLQLDVKHSQNAALEPSQHVTR